MNKYIEIIIKKYPEIQPNPSTYDLRKGATGYYGLANPTIQKSQTTGCACFCLHIHTKSFNKKKRHYWYSNNGIDDDDNEDNNNG